MNMKKTIAAIAAGSVAVSAMATTVSALDAKTLTYNLVETVVTDANKNTGTVTAFYSDVEIVAGDTVEITAANADPWGATITISGSYYDDQGNSTKTINPTVFTARSWETGWSQEGNDCWTGGDTVKIPVVAQKAGTAVALVQSSRANIQVKVDYKNLPDSIGYDGALNDEIKGQLRGIKLAVIAGTTTTTPGEEGEDKVSVVSSNAALEITGKYTGTASKTYKYVAGTDGTANLTQAGGLTAVAVADATATVDDTWTALSATTWANAAGDIKAAIPGVTLTGTPRASSPASQDATPTGITVDEFTSTAANNTKGNATIAYDGTTDNRWEVGGAAADPAEYGITFATGYVPSDGDQIVIANFTAAVKGDIVTTTAGKAAAWDSDPAADGLTVKGTPAANDVIIVTVTEGEDGEDTTVAAGENRYPAGVAKFIGSASNVGGSKETKQFPFETNLTTNRDVISYITKADGTVTNNAEFQNIRAVINDAVVNYNDVTFVFNTATKNVKTEWNADRTLKTYTRANGATVSAFYTDDSASDGVVTTYTDSSKKTVSGYYQVDDYKSFGRHYWDNNLGYDANTMYITSDWLGNNLFSGALVINSNLTLSLVDTDKFDWTGTSLSFSWDAIQDAALTQNQYANYIHNMVLRTSATWYWDNMQVVLGETETEEVDSGAPVEADDTDLEEEEADDLGDVDAEEEEEDEEPTVDVEPEPEVAPVETVTNPGTGNASVALAVIPVALAAAAIVAKKRG